MTSNFKTGLFCVLVMSLCISTYQGTIGAYRTVIDVDSDDGWKIVEVAVRRDHPEVVFLRNPVVAVLIDGSFRNYRGTYYDEKRSCFINIQARVDGLVCTSNSVVVSPFISLSTRYASVVAAPVAQVAKVVVVRPYTQVLEAHLATVYHSYPEFITRKVTFYSPYGIKGEKYQDTTGTYEISGFNVHYLGNSGRTYIARTYVNDDGTRGCALD